MNFFSDICLNLILLFFPMLVYLVCFAYKSNLSDKYLDKLFDFVLVLSSFLIFIYGNYKNMYLSLIINVPLIFSYLRKRSIFVILSVVLVLYQVYVFKFNILIVVLEYLLYYFVNYFIRKRNFLLYGNIMYFIVVKSFFVSFYSFYYLDPINGVFVNLGYIFLSLFFLYLATFLYYKLVQKTEDFVKLNEIDNMANNEKTVRNCLFRVTHEIKNPIAVCKGYLDMISKDKMDQYLPIIKSEINRSLMIMDDVLACSLIKLNLDIIDLNLLLEDTYQMAVLLLKDRGDNLVLDINDDEVYFMGDFDRLKQVMVNLIKNSIEARRDEGDLLINIRGYLSNDSYIIEVCDNGIGIDRKNLGKVGEMFFTTKVTGTGLGVNLCKEIIEGHKGSISYFSKKNNGTKVVIKLPIDKYLNV